jgi:transposase InsO family protein
MRGKPEAKDSGGGPHIGQAYSPGGAVKKSLKPAVRRELVKGVRDAYQLSEKRACGLLRITRWSNRYQSRKDSQAAQQLRLRELAGSRGRYGYRRLTVLLRREGWACAASQLAAKPTGNQRVSGDNRLPCNQYRCPSTREFDFITGGVERARRAGRRQASVLNYLPWSKLHRIFRR